ncbi:unnamed protein product [Sphagnum balticum]
MILLFWSCSIHSTTRRCTVACTRRRTCERVLIRCAQLCLIENRSQVVRLCARTALIDSDNGGTIGSYALSYLQSLFVVRATGDAARVYSVDEQIDVLNPPNTFAILDRAVYHLTKRDDLTTAIKLVS